MGPATRILLKEILSDAEKSDVIVRIQELSDVVRSNDFWIKGSPFAYSFGWEYEQEKEEYVGLDSLIGWAPKYQLVFSAMSNQKEDYFYLGDLCVEFSKRLNGFVDLGLPLADFTSDEFILNDPEHVLYDGASLLGPSLVKLWRDHKDFWLVK
ncbi:DUF6368 family protein [Litoribrevibacter euphylliae]|uniref:DUF6368 family protein n=1 Tax=Litoribrevibacter euphylliae TaxID=1834034 RepID=A0ABV7HKZ0_9GAMM